MRLLPGRLLDRYVLGTWIKIFVMTAFGFPLIQVIIDLADSFDRFVRLGLTSREIAP